MYSVFKALWFLQFMRSFYGDIELTCGSISTLTPANVTCVCTFSGKGVSWFNPNDTKLVNCLPSEQCFPTIDGFIFSIGQPNSVYRMTIINYSYSDCMAFTCKDIINSTVAKSARPSPAIFDSTTNVSLTEPTSGYSNGTIALITGCVPEYLKLKHTWFIVSDDDEKEYSIDQGRSIFVADNSSCNHCDTDSLASLTIGFQHNEATESGAQKVSFKIQIYHEDHPDDVIIRISKQTYTLKVNGTNEIDNNLSTILIIGLCIVIGLIVMIIIAVCCLMKVRINATKTTETTISFKATKPMLTICQKDSNYHVQCQMVKQNVVYDQENVQIEKEISISKLKPMTKYVIRVNMEKSWMCLSTTRTITTLSGTKPDPPIILESAEDDVTVTTITVRWTEGNNGGYEPKYYVHLNEQEHEVNQIVRYGDELRYTFENLTPRTTYKIMVKAKNEKGKADGPSLSFTTLGTKPDPPIMLESAEDDVTVTTITVRWTEGNNGGYEPKYYVYLNEQEHEVNQIVRYGDELRYTFENLTPRTTYKIMVKAKNEKGKADGPSLSFTTLAKSDN